MRELMHEARGLLKAAAARYVSRTQDVRAFFPEEPDATPKDER